MKAIYNIPYGLYVLTAKDEKFNGCIINTLMQVTSSPTRITITVNKDNYTTKMIEKTGEFNVSILDKNTDFELIKRFGFSSGKDTNKFDGFSDFKLAENQIPYITKNVNSYLSLKVISKIDVGTHITFVADVINDVVLSSVETVTYAYYLNNIKPKLDTPKKKVYVCRICGFVYEGDNLPEDFVCPICKHGAVDFELKGGEIKSEEQSKPQAEGKKKYYCPICGYEEYFDHAPDACVLCGAKMIEKD